MNTLPKARHHPRETQPLNVQPLSTRFVALYGSNVSKQATDFIDKLLQRRNLQAQSVDASTLSAKEAVMHATAKLSKNGHLLVCVHGDSVKQNNHETHYLSLDHGGLPVIATEALVKMVVDQLGIQPSRVEQPGNNLPFIYFFSCYSGQFRREIDPGSDLWKRANILILSGSVPTSILSNGNMMTGATAYVDHCQKNMQEVNPLKLLFFAGMHRGDSITLMGGKLSAPLVWHAPKSGQDQGRIDNLSGSPEYKQRFEQAVASIRPDEYRLLPAASLTEVLCNRISRDDVDQLRNLLVAHPELRDMPSNVGICPLDFAAQQHPSRCLRALLEAGADPNGKNIYGETALISAAKFSGPEISEIQTLLDYGADPNLHDASGRTALMEAAENGDINNVRALLNHGADPNLRDANGRTALMEAVENGDMHSIRALLDHGADPNLHDANGRTALMEACFEGHSSVVNELLHHGATLDLQDERGQTALGFAVAGSHLLLASNLLMLGANPDTQDSRGDTILIASAFKGDMDAVRLLLSHDADPDL